MALTEYQQGLKSKFVAARGVWGDQWESFLILDPAYFERYLNWMLVPSQNSYLPPKIQEFIHITINAATTHLHSPALRAHIQEAIRLGATKEEITEVLQLTSTVGIHACNIGVPLLLEVMKEENIAIPSVASEEELERLRQEFTQARGYWHQFWEDFLQLDPKFFEGYTNYSSEPWRTGTLEPKYKELIYCAFDSACTHLYVSGLKVHIQNALRLGATPQQVMEVLEIASLMGIQSQTTALPILREELERSNLAT